MSVDLDKTKTAIIPVLRTRKGTYIIEAADIIWNQIQIFILEGATKKNIIIEFKIEDET